MSTAEVIERCERLGIDASWGGAQLEADDVERLRGEFGAETGTASTETPPPVSPTAAVALPDDEPARSMTPPADEPTTGSRPGPPGGFARLSDDGTLESSTSATFTDRPNTQRAVLDASIRPSLIALVLAAALLVASQFFSVPAVVFGLWVLALLAAIVAIVSGNRARYHITSHPDRHRGLGLALIGLVGGVVVILGLGYGGYLATRAAPAKDALLGDLSSVQRLRWGYQRFRLVQDNEWHTPARVEGTCWLPASEGRGRLREAKNRDELPLRKVMCGGEHHFEVLAVYAKEPRPDVPFDRDAVWASAMSRCKDEFEDLLPPGGSLIIELPTERGWNRGDHDAACLFREKRSGSVTGTS